MKLFVIPQFALGNSDKTIIPCYGLCRYQNELTWKSFWSYKFRRVNTTEWFWMKNYWNTQSNVKVIVENFGNYYKN